MADSFAHGYALIVGIGDCSYPKWSLPVTVRDVLTLRTVLGDPNLCGYLDSNVRLLHDTSATRDSIVEGLAWLKAQTTNDSEATAIFYFSGHGWLQQSTTQYYLIPHDVTPFDIPNSALSAERLTDALRQVRARKLLVFIDSCHAEGMATAKDPSQLRLPAYLDQVPVPKNVTDELMRGEGRAVFTSCRGQQRSWVRPDGSMSVYTFHLVEALQGAGNRPGDDLVRVSNLIDYLGRTVPTSARQLCQAEQTPFFDTATEDFPVALLRGGKGLPAEGWTAAQEEAAETMRHVATITGTGVIAQGPGAVAVAGDVFGGIHTGRGDVIDSRRSYSDSLNS